MIDDTIKKNQDKDVVDVDLGFVEKRKFRIAGDYNRILELNVSDLNITKRLKEGYPKLQELLNSAQERIVGSPSTDDTQADLGELADRLTAIDNEMREIIDYIFDTNASEVCAPSGNMFDPVGGQYRFERIIEVIGGLYSQGLTEEFNALKKRVNKRTDKYTKNSKKSKK